MPNLNGLNVSISERQFGRVQGGPINLSRTELCRARLDQATLIEANLVGAALMDTDLSDARLEKADLRGAKLAYANLSGARLQGANVCGADLRLAKGLTQTQIDQALGDRRTALPANLTMPRAWLPEDQLELGQLVRQADGPDVGDKTGDPYAILGVSPGASIHDIRAVWLKLVKDLHPDGSSGEAPANERLKVINQAYQTLKDLERRAHRDPARAPFHASRAVFATFFVIAIAVGALVAGMEIYFARPDGTGAGDTTPVARTSVKEDAFAPKGPQTIPRAPSSQPPTNERAVGVDKSTL